MYLLLVSDYPNLFDPYLKIECDQSCSTSTKTLLVSCGQVNIPHYEVVEVVTRAAENIKHCLDLVRGEVGAGDVHPEDDSQAV